MCAAHGGRIGLTAGQSTVLTLCVSDIIGSPLSAIAGGPTTADPTTLEDCQRILARLFKNKPMPSVLEKAFISGNADELVPETPKVLPKNILPGIVLVDLQRAINAAAESCKKLFPGVTVLVLSSRLSGEAAELGRTLATIGADISLPRPYLILAGGETTVTMDSTKSGKGGRNQELALAAAIQMKKDDRCSDTLCLLSIGTDGTDGPTDAAGAVVTKQTIKDEVLDKALESLAKHDSYNFFSNYAPEAHVKTGPTGTNVMDLIMVADFGPNHSST